MCRGALLRLYAIQPRGPVRTVAPFLAGGLDQLERDELLAEIPLVEADPRDGLARLLQFRERETLRHQPPRDAFRVQPFAQALGRVPQYPCVVERQFGQFVDEEQARILRIASRPQFDAVGRREGDVDHRDDALPGIAIGTAECAKLLQVAGLEPGFLAKFPPGRAPEAFVDIDEAPGKRPLSGMRPGSAPNQNHRETSGHDREHGDVDGDGGMRMLVGKSHADSLVSYVHEY